MPIKSRLIAIADSAQSASTFAGSDVVRAVVSGDGELQKGVKTNDDSDDIGLVKSVLRVAPRAAFLSTSLTTQGREITIEKGGVLARVTSSELMAFITIWHRWIGSDDDMEIAVDVWIQQYGIWGSGNF